MSDPLSDDEFQHPGEPQFLVEKRIVVDGTTLIFPPIVQQQMHELDNLIVEQDLASEIFGFGLVKRDGTNSLRIVEFISPKQENIFNLNSFIINQDQSKLAKILSNANSLQLRLTETEVVLVPNGTVETSEWMHFPINSATGKIDWSFADSNLPDLFGFALPGIRTDLEEVMNKKLHELGSEQPDQELSILIKSDWDIVVSTLSCWVTGGFIARSIARAEEIGAEIGFSMHHHPTLGLFQVGASEKSASQISDTYRQLLEYSKQDVAFMHGMNVNFFEIRAFGDNMHRFSRENGRTTSRFYSVRQIFEEDEEIKKYILGNSSE